MTRIFLIHKIELVFSDSHELTLEGTPLSIKIGIDVIPGSWETLQIPSEETIPLPPPSPRLAIPTLKDLYHEHPRRHAMRVVMCEFFGLPMPEVRTTTMVTRSRRGKSGGAKPTSRGAVSGPSAEVSVVAEPSWAEDSVVSGRSEPVARRESLKSCIERRVSYPSTVSSAAGPPSNDTTAQRRNSCIKAKVSYVDGKVLGTFE